MADFLLVHGAWHASWCWQKLAPLLEQKGHRVILADLPGNGSDDREAAGVSLDDYAGYLTGLLAEAEEPVYLLGHSMGGMAISAAAEKMPEKVRALIYLAAFLPRDGESLADIEARNPKPSVPPEMLPARQPGACRIRSSKAAELFLHDCAAADQALALESMTEQPLAPLGQPVQLSAENFGSLPRFYILLQEDRAICPELQEDMIRHSPCQAVYPLASSHSPFFSRPEDLRDILQEISLTAD